MAKRKTAVAASGATLPSPPAELLQAIEAGAGRDADAVAEFLLQFFPAAGVGRPPVRLPADFLLGLGFALRLVAWEDQGHRPHLDDSLPPALDAVRDVIQLASAGAALKSERDAAFAELVARVRRLSIDRFAWQAPPTLGSAVVLGQVGEDALLDALARFVWDRRHELPGR
jgi:hypothetical protein